MRAVLQRVKEAAVKIDGRERGRIGRGLAVLLGVGRDDEAEDAVWLAEKTARLRIFPDGCGNMNQSLLASGGAALVVSQFTLYGDCRKGRRPSWSKAAAPSVGEGLYQAYCRHLAELGVVVKQGVFGAMMTVEIHNEGPVTLLIDSKKQF